jgi:hypothetical protein
MSISLLQHTQGIVGYEHLRFEYRKEELIIHIIRKKTNSLARRAAVLM